MHPRAKIRAAIVDMLIRKTSADERVYATREVPWKRIELPGIAVYALSDEPVEVTYYPEVAQRNATMEVLLVASVTEQVDDALDSLALQVEQLLIADPTFRGTADLSRYTGTQIGIAEDLGRPVGVARVTFEARYQP